jgi:acetyltransferase-like isoleucine patch superfamily enzyme
MKKKSLTYRLIKKVGLNFSEEEYGDISLLTAFKRAFKGVINAILLKYCMYSVFLSPLNYRKIRPIVWRWIGAKVGKDVFIGYEVWMDFNNSHLIDIEDNVHIANRCLLLCHQRNLSEYFVGDDYSKLPYHRKRIHLKKGCLIGMDTMIMPGVTIGEGAIVGAGSLVIKNIPAWTIATGRPAKVVKQIPSK